MKNAAGTVTGDLHSSKESSCCLGGLDFVTLVIIPFCPLANLVLSEQLMHILLPFQVSLWEKKVGLLQLNRESNVSASPSSFLSLMQGIVTIFFSRIFC